MLFGLYACYYAIKRMLRSYSEALNVNDIQDLMTLIFDDFENRGLLMIFGVAFGVFFVMSFRRRDRVEELKIRIFIRYDSESDELFEHRVQVSSVTQHRVKELIDRDEVEWMIIPRLSEVIEWQVSTHTKRSKVEGELELHPHVRIKKKTSQVSRVIVQNWVKYGDGERTEIKCFAPLRAIEAKVKEHLQEA